MTNLYDEIRLRDNKYHALDQSHKPQEFHHRENWNPLCKVEGVTVDRTGEYPSDQGLPQVFVERSHNWPDITD
jgi:hypothetical protein